MKTSIRCRAKSWGSRVTSNGKKLDFVRLVFDRLASAGSPSVIEREAIYAQCRKEVAASLPDEPLRAAALQELEKVIRRQELQALYEESLDDR